MRVSLYFILLVSILNDLFVLDLDDDSDDEYMIPPWLFEDIESAEAERSLEEGLPDIDGLSTLELGPGITPNDWLLCNGKPVHKQTICRLVINADFIHKSKNRPERVRGFSKPTWQPNLNTSADLIGSDTFVEGDHFATFLRHQKTVSLALVRCTKITRGRTKTTELPIPTITNPEANVHLEGQILTMRRVQLAPSIDANASTAATTLNTTSLERSSGSGATQSLHAETSQAPVDFADSSESVSQWIWVWDGGFVMADAKMRGSQVVTEKSCVISIAGHLCIPQVDCRSVVARERLPEDATTKINSMGTTWEFDERYLLSLSANLWEGLIKEEVRVDDLPVFPPLTRGGFPYAFAGVSASSFQLLRISILMLPVLLLLGKEALVNYPASERLRMEMSEDGDRQCDFCGEAVSFDKDQWRGHIGWHILRALCGAVEPRPLTNQVWS